MERQSPPTASCSKRAKTIMERNPIFSKFKDEVALVRSNDRHVLCPCYDTCLNEAVIRDQSFDCKVCLYKLCDIKTYKIHDGAIE